MAGGKIWVVSVSDHNNVIMSGEDTASKLEKYGLSISNLVLVEKHELSEHQIEYKLSHF